MVRAAAAVLVGWELAMAPDTAMALILTVDSRVLPDHPPRPTVTPTTPFADLATFW